MSVKISVDTLYQGGVGERIKQELDNVVKNIMDPNTPAKKKRTVTLKLEITPNEGRNLASMKVITSSTLCAPQPIETNISIVSNIKTGEVFCEELVPNENQNQLSFPETNVIGKATRDTNNDSETAYNPTFQQ